MNERFNYNENIGRERSDNLAHFESRAAAPS